MKFIPEREKSVFTIDYWLWKKKTGALLTKLIPYASATAKRLVTRAYALIVHYTPKTETGTDIKGMWRVENRRLATKEEFIIKNLYPNQDIIVFFEEGTKPHEIVPKRKMFLHFFTKGGAEVFTKHVSHPGTPAYQMIAKTEKQMDPLVNAYVKQTFEMANKIMSEGR